MNVINSDTNFCIIGDRNLITLMLKNKASTICVGEAIRMSGEIWIVEIISAFTKDRMSFESQRNFEAAYKLLWQLRDVVNLGQYS